MGLRVLHIGKFYPPVHGGIENFVADLLAEQRRQGIDAHALVHGEPQPGDPAHLTRVPVQASLVHAPIALGFRSALAQAIARIEPDVLHLHVPNTSVFWCLTLPAARRIPWVVHWHSDVLTSRQRTALRLAYVLYRPFEQAVLARASRIIPTSPPYLATSEPLRPWGHKCVAIPLGIGPAGPVDAALADAHWGDAGGLRLLTIGRLAHYKGLDRLVQVVSGLPGVQLCIVGDGEQGAALQAQVQALKQADDGEKAPAVRLLGAVDDATKNALLASCDVFCLASNERTEAFGLVLLEAMQFGRPCLVSDLHGSGMPWVVGSADAGVCVPTDDQAQWRASLLALQQQPERRARLGHNGQQALLTRFSIAACATAVAQTYAGCEAIASNCAPADSGAVSPPRTLIVIPARNESATIGSILAQLRAIGWRDVLVIDDHSSDGTGDIARAGGAHVLQPVLPLGAWGGMQAGIRYGLANGFAAVITMDGDGQHEVSELSSLLNATPDADLVIGAFPERASRLRLIAWAWFRRLAGFELNDLTSGFRHYNRAAMEIAASAEATLLDYQDLGTLLLIHRAGLHIVEVPVSMNLRVSGQSRIFSSWFSVARYMAATTLLCLSKWSVTCRGN